MQKVKLREATLEDAQFLFEMMQDKDYQKYYLDRLLIKSFDSAQKYIRGAERESKKGKSFCYIIMYGKERAGLLDIYKINQKDKRCSIGYGLAKEYWGKGVTSIAVSQGLKIMKNKLKLHACEGTIDPANIGSAKVLEKNGFKKIGLIEDYYWNNKKFVDRILYWKVL